MSSFKVHRPARAWARLSLVATALLAAGCGYQPLYGQSTASLATTQELAAIEVGPIPDRIGQQMRTALERRLRLRGRPEQPYFLSLGLEETRANLAEEKSGAVTRANLTLTGTYELSRKSDHTSLVVGSARVVASFNILDSEFATLSAEKDARARAIELLADEIRTRLAIYFRGPHAEGRTTGGTTAK